MHLAELSQCADAMDGLFFCSDFMISCPSKSFLCGLFPSYRLNSVARSRRPRLPRGFLCWYNLFTRWEIVVAQYYFGRKARDYWEGRIPTTKFSTRGLRHTADGQSSMVMVGYRVIDGSIIFTSKCVMAEMRKSINIQLYVLK